MIMKEMTKRVIRFFIGERSVGQFVRYLITGFSSFFLEYLLFFIMFKVMGMYGLTANSIAICIAFCYNFMLNRIWSFKSRTPIQRQFVQYGALFLFNMAFSNGFIYAMSRWLGVSPLISKILAMGCIVIWNFVIYKVIIFRHHEAVE